MISRQTASRTSKLQYSSPVKVNGQPTGIQITIELDPTAQNLSSPAFTEQRRQILSSITNLIATHLAIAENAVQDSDKIKQYGRLEKILLLALGLYPAGDGRPDLKLHQARPALAHLLLLKKPKGKSDRGLSTLRGLADNYLDL